MGLYERYSTSADLEKEGVWVDFGEGTKFKIARFGNDSHTKLMNKLRNPHKGKRELSKDVQDSIIIEGLARCLIKDWEGVTDAKNKSIPFSVEACLTLMIDLPDLRNDIATVSPEAESFRIEQKEKAAKN